MEKIKKDQFVIAYLPIITRTQTVLAHANYLAKMLNKGLILLHICDEKYSSISPEEAEQTLKDLANFPNTSYCTLKGNTEKIIANLPNLLNSVVIVTEVDPNTKKNSPIHPKNILKNFADCSTAWLTVQPNITPLYKDIALTTDYTRESKEKLVWASYYARFGESNIHVLYQDYKDEGLHKLWYSNMLFLHKLYNSLNITYQPHPIIGKSSNADKDALPYMKNNHISLLVTVTTPTRSLLDHILTKPELHTIQNKEKIPIMFINPRKDLYILCD